MLMPLAKLQGLFRTKNMFFELLIEICRVNIFESCLPLPADLGVHPFKSQIEKHNIRVI